MASSPLYRRSAEDEAFSDPPLVTVSRSEKPAPRASAPSFPSREEIMAFIARERAEQAHAGESAAKIGKREIARHFGIKGSAKIDLKHILKDLEAEGQITRQHKSLHKTGTLPAVVVLDILSRDRDGELVATPVEWDAESQGKAPCIVIHTPRKPRPGQVIAGLGNRVLARCTPDNNSEDDQLVYVARVIKILSRSRLQTIGIYRVQPKGGGRLIPVDKKNMNRELVIAEGDQGAATDGDLVSVEIIREGRHGLPSARVRERLGSMANERAISQIALQVHGIPHVFSQETMHEANQAIPARMDGREDWRHLPLITIDPADAKDHDDAVLAQRDSDPNNLGGFVLTVAIADVAAYVKPGSHLDREAVERGNSVYFPDRVVPMLPERISNDLCSLRPLEDRPALAVRMIISAEGRKIKHSFHRVMMRSAAKLSYPQAQTALDGTPDAITEPLMSDVLQPLWETYQALKMARDKRAPLDLDLPERKLILNEDGSLNRVFIPPRLESMRLIEECMILANVAAAESLEDHRQPLIYRVHDEPSQEKLNALFEFLASMDMTFSKGQVLKPQQFNGLLAQVKGNENEHLINEIVLRAQAQAEYAAENYGHFGLNLRRYAHFTSPIRRYADLIVHRALIKALKFGRDGLPDVSTEELNEIAARISAAERRAMAAERETNDRLIASWLANKIGASFTGRIAGVTRAGLFVKLEESGADGFIPAATLGQDYFRHDERLRALIGNRSGASYQLGDVVDVRLIEAAPFAGALRFEMLSDGLGTKRAGNKKTFAKGKAGRPESASLRANASSPQKHKSRRSSSTRSKSRSKGPQSTQPHR